MKHTINSSIINQTCSFHTLVSRHLKPGISSFLAARSWIIVSVKQYSFLSIKQRYFFFIHLLCTAESFSHMFD